jgi:membrane protein
MPAMAERSTPVEVWRSVHTSRVLRDGGAYVLYAVRRFYRDGGLQAAAALTYTTLLALVPLMTIAFAIFSAFPAFQAVQYQIELLLFQNLVPEVGSIIQSHISEFTRNATNLTTVGVVALAVSAVLLLSTVESVFNRIWRVERERPILTRLLIFWTVLTLGPVLMGASFTLTTGVFDWIGQFANESVGLAPISLEGDRWVIGGRLLAAALQATAFTILFVLVPARPVRLRDAAVGGAIAGVALEILKWVFRLYVVGFPSYQAIYGALAAVPIFLIWLYLSWTVIIMGAVFAASFSEWRSARAVDVEAHLDPARKLEAAVVLLSLLSERARTGGQVSQAEMTKALPMDARDGLADALRQAGYLSMTERGEYALTRDLHATSLVQLARDLGLTLGLDTQAVVGASDRRAARRLDAATGDLAGQLAEVFTAEERILGMSIASLLETAEGSAGSEAVPLPITLSRTPGA